MPMPTDDSVYEIAITSQLHCQWMMIQFWTNLQAKTVYEDYLKSFKSELPKHVSHQNHLKDAYYNFSNFLVLFSGHLCYSPLVFS